MSELRADILASTTGGRRILPCKDPVALRWITAPILFVIAIVALVRAMLPSGKGTYQCQDCKHWFSRPMGLFHHRGTRLPTQ